MKPFISLCMIVRDEEKVLKRCLNSVKDYVDEIIIVDTGSTDNTKNIALSYTKQVYDFEWINDFSVARNFAQSKARGQWIIYLDADEYVEQCNMKKALERLKELNVGKHADAFLVKQVNFVGTTAGDINQCPTIRIYKNESEIRFKRKIHEQLYHVNRELDVGILDLNIYHSGYMKGVFEEKAKNFRNTSLIKDEISKNPNNGFDYYNLGNEYLAQWEVNEALIAYKKAYQLKGSVDIVWVPIVIERLVFCLLELKNYDDALKIIEDAVTQWPSILDYRSQRALIYFRQKRYDDAIQECNYILKNKGNYQVIQSLSYVEYLPFFILGRIYEYKKNVVESVYNYSSALNYNNKDIDILKCLYPILIKQESNEGFISFIQSSMLVEDDQSKAYLLKILLDIGEHELIENLLKIWHVTCSKGFKFKLNIGKGKFNLAYSIFNKLNLNEDFSEGWFDSIDVLILALQLNKEELIHRVLKVSYSEGLEKLKCLFEKEKVPNEFQVKQHIILLIERCIKLKSFELIDDILKKLDVNYYYIEIGDLLYNYGFEEVAFHLYSQLEGTSMFTEQSYINIIQYLQGEKDREALDWAYNALEKGYEDYRIYYYTIKILYNMHAIDDLQTICKMALEVYPDSNYILGQREKLYSLN